MCVIGGTGTLATSESCFLAAEGGQGDPFGLGFQSDHPRHRLFFWRKSLWISRAKFRCGKLYIFSDNSVFENDSDLRTDLSQRAISNSIRTKWLFRWIDQTIDGRIRVQYKCCTTTEIYEIFSDELEVSGVVKVDELSTLCRNTSICKIRSSNGTLQQ